jgi:citrate synthase
LTVFQLHIQWGVLSSLTSALTAFNPKVVNVKQKKKCMKRLHKTMQVVLVVQLGPIEKMMGYPLNYYDTLRLCYRKFYTVNV